MVHASHLAERKTLSRQLLKFNLGPMKDSTGIVHQVGGQQLNQLKSRLCLAHVDSMVR